MKQWSILTSYFLKNAKHRAHEENETLIAETKEHFHHDESIPKEDELLMMRVKQVKHTHA